MGKDVTWVDSGSTIATTGWRARPRSTSGLTRSPTPARPQRQPSAP